MKQIVLEAPGRFTEREAPVPIAATGQALVQIEKVGVCGSDFHAFAGRHPIYTYPRIIGHELSGIVMEVPANDRGIQAGDRCAIEPYMSCGKCRACAMGRNNCCEHIRLLGIHVDGGMQEYLSVPLELLHKSNQLSLDQLALVETLGIGAHAVLRSRLKAGDEALIVGAGPIGIAVAQFASALGATVHIVEKNEWRRAFVERMGYTASYTAEDRQADAVFDATGNADAMGSSMAHVATGGSLVYVGLTRDPVCFDDVLFHRKEITLLASRNSFNLFPQIIQLIEEGKIDTSHWITDRLKLSEVASQFQFLATRQTLIKAIVDVNRLDS
ncbi:MAG TPA: zinc-binding alcohol dehydrogenase family protein [Acidobacteriaceae bacterium]|jgi:2-desacetyl-2-hydroxyethyl bacteriochlorophyllide A dehydrogenase|nr:zinc-binding alcohol dehydrogenase family protein [Acidobacteriaceae bacterium]